MPAAKPVTFVSKHPRYKLIRRAEVEEIVAGIGRRVVQKPVRYQFAEGRLIVTPGRDRMVDSADWLAAGEDQDEERDVVAALKAHRSFGQDGKFWLEGHGPGVLYPREQEVRAELDAAIATLNEPVVRERLSEERGSHNRSVVVEWCESALSVIAQMEAAMAEKQAATEPKQEKKG